MSAAIKLVVSVLVLVWCVGCDAQPALHRLAIPDNNGFERPMTAYSLDAPAGWQGQGGIAWDPLNPCQDLTISIQWQARSPDGRQGFELLPRWATEVLDGANSMPMSNCQQTTISSVRGYLEAIARSRHPNGRLLDYRDRPDRAAQIPVMQLPNYPGIPLQSRTWAEAGEILVGWSEHGQEMRETILAGGVVTEQQFSMPMMGESRSKKLSILSTAAMHAPDGQLDLNLFNHMVASIQPGPEWSARMNQHTLEMSRTSANGARERAQIQANTQAQIAASRDRAWQEQQAANESSHASYIQSIRGVQQYHDPSAGAVELSNQYDHAWRLQNGTHIQTNNPNFNPWVGLGVDGEEMAPIR